MPYDDKDEVLGDLAGFDEQFKKTEEAPDGGGMLLPPGTYRCGVQDFTWLKSKEKGNRGLKIVFEVIEPAVVKGDDGKEVETLGKPIGHVLWITDKNIPYVKRDAHKILGRELTSIRELAEINWMECFAELVVGHEKDLNDRMQNRVRFINPWKPSAQKTEGAKDDDVAF